jgi:hypothetical protein
MRRSTASPATQRPDPETGASVATTPVERLCAALSAFPGVDTTRSRFGSGQRLAWRIAGREFAHLHSETLIDLRLPRAVQARLRSDARAHFRAGASQWLELEFQCQRDVEDLLVLARKAAAAVWPRGK